MSTWGIDLPAERMNFVSAFVEQSDIQGADAGQTPWNNRLRAILALIRDGECESAIAEVTEIIWETQAPAAYLTLAEAHLRQGQYDLALVSVDILLLGEPDCAQAILMKGLVRRECGALTEAANLLQTAAQRAPSLLLAWRALIDLSLEQGRTFEAARFLSEALQHSPARGTLTVARV